MKTIRWNTFETNSSSCHSITFSNTPVEKPSVHNLVMFADHNYCGEGELTNPEDKATYFSVAMVENFRRLLHESKKKYYQNSFSEIADIFEDMYNLKLEDLQDWRVTKLPTPQSMRHAFISLFENRMNEIEEYFRSKGVKVKFNSLSNSYSSADEGIIIVNNEYNDDYDEIITYGGSIDHESSPLEGVEDAITLAELPVEDLFNFIFNDSIIDCEYYG